MNEKSDGQLIVGNEPQHARGLKPVAFWFAMAGFAILNYLAFNLGLKVSVVLLDNFLAQSEIGGVFLIIYFSSLFALVVSAIMALVSWLVLRNNFVGKKAAYPLLVVFFVVSFVGISYIANFSVLYYRNIVAERKVASEGQTYGEHQITSDKQAVYNGYSNIIETTAKDLFAWIGEDDTNLKDNNPSNLIVLTTKGDKFDKEKVSSSASSAVITENKKIYWVDHNLYEYDTATKQQKMVLADVGDIKSEYQGKIILPHANILSVFDPVTGVLDDISTVVVGISSDDIIYSGKYIFTKVTTDYVTSLTKYDVLNHSKTTAVDKVYLNESMMLYAANDQYIAYSITSKNNGGATTIFTVIGNSDNRVKFSEELSDYSTYFQRAKFVDDSLYISTRNSVDGNKFDISEINLKTAQKSIVFDLSGVGSGVNAWDLDGSHIIYSTGFYGQVILTPFVAAN
ncbi:MAG: hypothetical protein WCG48_04315 [Candidatus Berkelbacteria bacterium]